MSEDTIESSSKDMMGTVKFFDERRGWGFLTTQGVDGDIFIHYKHIIQDGYRSLVKNELVVFELTTTVKGLMATKIRKLS